MMACQKGPAYWYCHYPITPSPFSLLRHALLHPLIRSFPLALGPIIITLISLFILSFMSMILYFWCQECWYNNSLLICRKRRPLATKVHEAIKMQDSHDFMVFGVVIVARYCSSSHSRYRGCSMPCIVMIFINLHQSAFHQVLCMCQFVNVSHHSLWSLSTCPRPT